MVVDVSRGHILVKLMDRNVTVHGEMFFPGGDKLGFVIYSDTIKFWDPPNQNMIVTPEEKQMIIDDIRADFMSGGHTLEVE
ncbi:Imm74 family immunity protein [Pandoraea pnomenusa]|uniref:Imm74 family immunity protein n=1 Tax=Pandoraea pnomenusa TaxID=93220 RepID=UPI000437645A|nr:hypothetical protein FKQ53_04785 [Pandoraea pnomenusa]